MAGPPPRVPYPPLDPLPPEKPLDPCQQLSFDARLQSLNRIVVASIKQKDVLNIQVQELSVLAVSPLGVVGSITEQLPQLKSCIEQGYKYVAVVTSVSDGLVKVRVQPAVQS